MNLTARCHSLRPDRHSGWLTYFELTESGPRAAHFLVVGPPTTRGPEDVQAALRAGQAAVRYLKEVPAHAPPLTLLEATARILDHESGKTGNPLEFGCAVLEGSELWLLTRGSVRLVLIAPQPGVPLGAERPHAVSVDPEERYFFGRVLETAGGAPSPDLKVRLERGGGGEGGLVLNLVTSDRLREVVPGGDPLDELVEHVPQLRPGPAVSEPLALPEARPDAPPPAHPDFQSVLDALRKAPEVSTISTPSPPPVSHPAPKSAPPSILPEEEVTPSERGESAAEGGLGEPVTLHTSTTAPGRPLRTFAPEETRGLGFWIAVVAAGIILGALIVYLGFLRPQRPERSAGDVPAPPAPEASASLVATSAPPEVPRLLWEDRFTDAVTSSPVVAADRVIFGCRDGRVYALNRIGGARLWSYGSTAGFGSSPVLLRDLVILGGYDGTVYAFDPQTGERRWTTPTRSRITASPAVDSTTVYIGSYDHRLYAIDAGRGTVRWSRDLGAILWASPAVGDGIVAAAGLDGRLHAVDARNGRVRWSVSLGAPVHSSPAIGEGVVLVGSKGGSLIAFDLAAGHEVWRVEAGGEVNGSPAIQDGWVVVGTESGRVIGVELAAGRIAWRLETGGEVRSRPAFAGNLVWITGYDGRLRGVDFRTGEERISYSAGSSAFSSPAVAGDTVFYGGLDGRFLAVKTGVPP